jgi:transcriptional regulator with XRE-family HTH domain
MDYIRENIRYLRRLQGLTQEELSDTLNIKRSQLGAYEEGRAKPNYEVLVNMAKFFSITLDAFITKNLEKSKLSPADEKDVKGKNLRVLSLTVDNSGKENIELVPVKAAAGYMTGYSDPTYLEELNKFRLPFLPESTYRAFEIKGDSMYPLPSGSIVVGEYLENWKDIKDGQTYLVISNHDGIAYKRVFSQIEENQTLVMRSDNPSYPAYSLPIDEVHEVWRAVLHISYANKGSESSFHNIVQLMQEMQKDIKSLKRKD